MQYFGNAWSYKFKFSELSNSHDSNNWGKFAENLRGMGNIFILFLSDLIWNYSNLNLFNTLKQVLSKKKTFFKKLEEKFFTLS